MLSHKQITDVCTGTHSLEATVAKYKFYQAMQDLLDNVDSVAIKRGE